MKLLWSPDAATGGTGGGAAGTQGDEGASGSELFNSPPGAHTEGGDGAGQGGAGAGGTGEGAGTGAGEGEGTGEGAGAGAGEEATAALRGPGLSKEDIQALVKEISGVNRQAPAATTGQQPQLTAEQVDQMFQVYRPSADLITKLRSEDPNVAIQAITEMRDGMLRQAMAMVNYYTQEQLKATREELSGQINPLNEYVSERRAVEFRSDFFKANHDLEPYEQLVDAVAVKISTSMGDKFHELSREDRLKLFATESKKLVAKLTANGGAGAGAGDGNGNGAGQGATGGQPAGRKMSTLTGGGQTGGGGKGTGAKTLTGNKNIDAGLAALD